MDIPSTATAAAAALIDTAGGRDAPHGYGRHAQEGDDPVEALTRRVPPGPLDDAATRRRRAWVNSQRNLDASLPVSLLTVPAESVGGLCNGDFLPEVRQAEGWPAGVGVPVAPRRLQAGRRWRRLVVPTEPPGPMTPGPLPAWGLTVSVLVARSTADALEAWAGHLVRSDATRARAEAGTYRAYADQQEARIPAAFAWLEGLPERAPAPAFRTVPATARGIARLGTT